MTNTNGSKGVFDLKPYLGRGTLRELQDEAYFKQVGIFLGAVTWPNEQDIPPETLVAELKPAADSFRRGWQEAQQGETLPVSELWNGIDAK